MRVLGISVIKRNKQWAMTPKTKQKRFDFDRALTRKQSYISITAPHGSWSGIFLATCHGHVIQIEAAGSDFRITLHGHDLIVKQREIFVFSPYGIRLVKGLEFLCPSAFLFVVILTL